jgi:ligand-binding SRPBCC domain-containing protein
MVTIRLTTWINAPVERCFRLATSVAFYSAEGWKGRVENARGTTLQAGDTVSYSDWSPGLRLAYINRIEEVRPFTYFREEQVTGGFYEFRHEHYFAPMDDGTRIRDEVQFSLPLGPVGLLLERMLARRTMKKLLTQRHRKLKHTAESGGWQNYVQGELERGKVPERVAKVTKMQRLA